MKNSIFKSAALLFLSYLVFACNNESEQNRVDPTEEGDDFISFALSSYEEVVDLYEGKHEVYMTIHLKDSISTAVFSFDKSVKSDTKTNREAFSYESSKSSTTADCDGGFSCGRAIADCLKNGGEATMRNDSCRSYCVTCNY